MKSFTKHSLIIIAILLVGIASRIQANLTLPLELHEDTSEKSAIHELQELVAGGIQPQTTQSNRLRQVQESRTIEKLNKLDKDILAICILPDLESFENTKSFVRQYSFTNFRYQYFKLFEIFCCWKFHFLS